MTVRWSVGDARNSFCELLDGILQGESVVITRNGKPIVKMVAFGGEVEAIHPSCLICQSIESSKL